MFLLRSSRLWFSCQRCSTLLQIHVQNAAKDSVNPFFQATALSCVHSNSINTSCITEQQHSESSSSKISGSFYNAEQQKLQATVHKIIDTDINPFVDQWEAEGIFPAHKLFKQLGNAGLLGITKPTEYGGLGLGYKYNMALGEAMGRVNCGGVPMAVSVQTDMATPALAWFGSDALKREFLAPSIAGDLVSCIGVSESHAGSDVAGIKTTARIVGDDLILNGSKMWITNGAQADWMCCLANTSAPEGGPGGAHANKSLICVPMKEPGVRVARKLDKLGMRSSDTAEIFFDDVRLPVSNIIGEPGAGFMYQMMQFQEERMSIAVGMLSPLEMLIEETGKYARERQVYGKPLVSLQSVHFRLAELQTELEAFRALVYRAADLYVSGQNVTTLASMAKLKAGRLAREVTDTCLQFWGGMGFTNEVLVSRMYRDLRLVSIGGGADEVMLGIIAKNMGNMPSKRR